MISKLTQTPRHGNNHAELEDTALHLRRPYHRAIRDAEQRHSEEPHRHSQQHLENSMIPATEKQSMETIPTLTLGGWTMNGEQGKAHSLLETFWSPPLKI